MKNVKMYNVARTALTNLGAAIKTEAKSDKRFARGAKRIERLLAMLTIAEAKYEIVHGRKPRPERAEKPATKKKAKKAATKKAAKKTAPKKTAKVISLHDEARHYDKPARAA